MGLTVKPSVTATSSVWPGDDDALASLVASMSSTRSLANVRVGVLSNGRKLFAATSHAREPVSGTDVRHHRSLAGCLAKPVTATLAAIAVAEARLSWTSRASEVLGATGDAKRALSGVTIRHLLNHSHGLDDSAIPALPRTSSGRIDWQSLCGQLATRPIAAPGEMYSYGCVGPWLAAAILETLYSRSFGSLSCERLAQVFDLHLEVPSSGYVCPATGGDLSLTTEQWLSFLRHHLVAGTIDPPMGLDDSLLRLRLDQCRLPGWNLIEHACCLGWKSYGSSWFGHNSNLRYASSLLRFHPWRQVAIVITAPRNVAFAALATLFGHLAPEFANVSLPPLLTASDRQSLDVGRYTGTYTQAGSSLQIRRIAADTLGLVVCEPSSRASGPTHLLRAAANNVFIQKPWTAPEFPVIQFITDSSGLEYRYAWNGRQLWRRA